MTECLRCGRCCLEGTCKYLVHLPDGKTYCKIYQRRLGLEVAPGRFCLTREDSLKCGLHIDGCPFEKGVYENGNV